MSERRKKSSAPLWALSLLIAIIIVALGLSLTSTRAETPLQVTFIDVGQGDSAWLRTPDGLNILIDGGDSARALTYLQSQGVTTIDWLVATHPHEDHIGGLIPVLETLTVRRVLWDGQVDGGEVYRRFLDLITRKAIPDTRLHLPQVHTVGCCVTARVINPENPLRYDGYNPNSVALKVTHGQVSFLFMADVTTEAENDILARSEDVAAAILKVGHHGDNDASSAAFLAAVRPREAILSVGADNPWGHPSPAVLTRLSAVGARLWRTDSYGSIVITSDGATYRVVNDALIPRHFHLRLPHIAHAPFGLHPKPTPHPESASR